jgi:Cu2+-exporting ATPase
MTCCGVPTIDTLPKAASTSAVAKENDLLASSQKLEGKQIQTDFSVPQMHCIACIRSLENAVGSLPFVERVRANLSLKKISVVWNKEEGNALAIDQAITAAGFSHSAFDLSGDDNEQTNRSNKLLIALAVAGFAAVNIMLLSISVWSGADTETTRLFHLISGIIAVPAVMFSGQPFFSSALTALKAGRLNMDVPISLAVLLALGMSIYESLTGGNEAYFDAAVTLLFFLLIGRYLDNLMRDKARSAVVQLSRLATKGAMIVSADATLQYFKLDNIKPGMIVRVMAGDHIPVDGEIIKGSSDVDRSLVTGESLPHPVKKGIDVEAGILNLTGTIDILVKHDARHSFLGEVQRMMEAAEQGRGYYTGIADRMARIYAPAVHILALLAFAGWMIATGGDWHLSVYVAISVLIITCPCALGLAVPVVHVVAARRLFKQGIIIRDGSGFERLEEVDHIVFDKTGTLTSGVPQLSLSAKYNGFTESAGAIIARTLASHSSHPFSKALTGFLNVPITGDIVDIKETPGAGVEARIMGQLARLGQHQWVRQIADPGSSNASEVSGLSFAQENGEVVTFEHSEELRRGCIPTIAELNRQGVEIEILSGDSHKSVKTIADRISIDEIRYGQRPADKVSRINELKKLGKKVLMAGDGLNDSPALAAAHVSIAPANASDIARYAADFVFTRENLTAVSFAMHIAKRSGSLVRQNFSLAILYNAIAIPFALAGFVTPLIAAIAMSASSIVVVANSMRLNLDNKAQVRLGSRLQLDDGFKTREKFDDPPAVSANSGRTFV